MSFYVIKIVNEKTGELGFIMENEKGEILIIRDQVTASVKQFASRLEAKKYIVQKQLERKRVKAYIYSSEQLVDTNVKGLKKIEGDLFCIVSIPEGFRVFYDTKKNTYYWDNREVGFCVWNTQESAQGFIQDCLQDTVCIVEKLNSDIYNHKKL